jgi:hypothetical protein
LGAPAALLLGLGLLAVGAAFFAACLRPAGPAGFLLAAFTVGWAGLVSVVFALSPFALVTRAWLLAALALFAAAGLGVWSRLGRPPMPSLRAAAVAAYAAARADPALTVLAALVAAAFAYVVALAFATPPLDFDALLYHLPRAALWWQDHGVGYIPGSSDPRLDGNPPGAEIGALATMVLWRGDRFVALPQLLSLAACCLATFGIGRRVGLARGQALFGALLVATLPVLAVQAVTAYNDVVVAAFLAIVVYAALGHTRADLVLLALALGLALTTKPTAIVTLPLLLLVAAVGAPRSRWGGLLAATGCGLVLGAPWYVLNLAETGTLDGGVAQDADQRQPLALLEVATTLRRHVYGLLDFSGTRAFDLTALYGATALAVLTVGLVAALRGGRGRGVLLAVGAAVVVFLPRALVELGDLGMHGWVKAWVVLGRRDIADADASWQVQTASDAGLSWYGPLGAVLVAAAVVIAVARLRRGAGGWTPLVLAAAPLLLIGVFALTVTWDPWRGRLLAVSILLSAATWGLALPHRWLAWGTVALAAVTVPLALSDAYGRPLGLAWLDQDRSVWSESREALLEWRQSGSGAVRAGRELAGVPNGATVAVAPLPGDLVYPLLDPTGRRRSALVGIDGGRVPERAGWLVVAPGSRVERCGTWRRVTDVGGWAVEQRTSVDGPCASAAGASP